MAILKMEQVINSWGTIIEGGAGQGDCVIKIIERLLDEKQAPKIKVQHKTVSPGVLQHIFGGKRPFLVISNNMGQNIQACKVHINARDYGVFLQVSWYLVNQPGWMERLTTFIMNIPIVGLLLLPGYAISKISSSKETGIIGLSVFDEQDLTAFTSVVHGCVQDAIEEMTKEAKIDLPKIDRKAKGFLNIS